MANLKARLDKVIKAAISLLHSLPKDYFLYTNGRYKNIGFDHFPEDPNVEEIKTLLKLEKKKPTDYWASSCDLMSTVSYSRFASLPQVKPKLEKLVSAIDYYRQKNIKKELESSSIKVEKTLDSLHPKQLKKIVLDSYSNRSESDELTKKALAVLASKPHIISAAQSKLIRKMSIHAGKKLSLREAQLLSNKLKEKSKK
jgi:hypothetical protein